MAEIVKVNAKELKSFGEKNFAPNVVYQSSEILVLCILDGEAEVVAGNERLTAAKDDLIVIPKGAKRGVKALTEVTILHVVQPPPAAEDHNEVHAKLAQGKFE